MRWHGANATGQRIWAVHQPCQPVDRSEGEGEMGDPDSLLDLPPPSGPFNCIVLAGW